MALSQTNSLFLPIAGKHYVANRFCGRALWLLPHSCLPLVHLDSSGRASLGARPAPADPSRYRLLLHCQSQQVMPPEPDPPVTPCSRFTVSVRETALAANPLSEHLPPLGNRQTLEPFAVIQGVGCRLSALADRARPLLPRFRGGAPSASPEGSLPRYASPTLGLPEELSFPSADIPRSASPAPLTAQRACAGLSSWWLGRWR